MPAETLAEGKRLRGPRRKGRRPFTDVVTASCIVGGSRLGGLGGDHVARATRVNDLCVIPYAPGEDGQRSVATPDDDRPASRTCDERAA